MVIEVTKEMIEHRVDAEASIALARMNLTEQVVAQLKEEGDALTAQPIDSKERLALVKGLAKRAQMLRVAAEKYCKAQREEANMVRNVWVAKEKSVVGPITEVEQRLDARIGEWEAEQQRMIQEEERARAAAERQRFLDIAALGFVLVHGNEEQGTSDRYALDGSSFPVDDIKAADAETWANILRSARMVSDEYQDRQRKAREEEQTRELERKQREEQLAQQAEDQRNRELQLRQRVAAMRRKELMGADFELVGDRWQDKNGHAFTETYIKEADDADWDMTLANVKAQQEEFAAKRRADQERAAIIQERKDELLAMGATINSTNIGVSMPGNTPGPMMDIASLYDWSTGQWEGQKEAVKRAVERKRAIEQQAEEDRKVAEAEKLEHARINGERTAELKAIGAVVTGEEATIYGERILLSHLCFNTNEAWASFKAELVAKGEQLQQEEQRRLDEKKSDREKFEAYIAAIQAVPVPLFASPMVTHAADNLGKYIANTLRGMQKDLN